MFLLFNLVTHVDVDHDDDDDVQVTHQDINVCHNVSAGENISLTLENISSLLDKNYFILSCQLMTDKVFSWKSDLNFSRLETERLAQAVITETKIPSKIFKVLDLKSTLLIGC